MVQKSQARDTLLKLLLVGLCSGFYVILRASISAGFEPANLGPPGEHATLFYKRNERMDSYIIHAVCK